LSLPEGMGAGELWGKWGKARTLWLPERLMR